MARVRSLSAVVMLAIPSAAWAQAPIYVTARAVDGTPVEGAIVTILSSGVRILTDRLGRAYLLTRTAVDTVVVHYVGFVPDTIVVDGDHNVTAVLSPRVPTLADLTVFADDDRLSPSITGHWVLPRALTQQIPVAVEPDPLRALSLVPSVSFSSPLSARPILRGYDAEESVVRLDGYEVQAPYHVARAFSSITGEALDRVVVTPAVFDPSTGGALAGTIDLYGRGASGGHGIAVSPVSVVGWLGSGERVPAFGAVRIGFLKQFTGLVGEGVPYQFGDAYLHSQVSLEESRRLDATGYASHDRVGDETGEQGMNWSNGLLGLRMRLVESPLYAIDLGGSYNRFSLVGTHLPLGASLIDVHNTIVRSSVSMVARFGTGRHTAAGAGLTDRHVATTVAQLSGDRTFPGDSDSRLTEYQLFAEHEVNVGPLTIQMGLRLDASARARAAQPRARIATSVTNALGIAVSYQRMAKLFYVMSDPQAEPEILFPQFFLRAGEGGVPVPSVDHAAISVDITPLGWLASGAVFASLGRNVGELRRDTDPVRSLSPFRFGRSRTAGIEVRVSRRATGEAPPSFAITYVLSRSERRFDDQRWTPWILDRTHLLRAQASRQFGQRWSVFLVMETQSGQPLTRVGEVFRVDQPSADPQPGTGPLAYVYDQENANRSAGTVRFDVGAQLRLRGPRHTDIVLGASVINAGFGPVAPQSPLSPKELDMLGPSQLQRGVVYRRAYSLPAVPTVTARWEF